MKFPLLLLLTRSSCIYDLRVPIRYLFKRFKYHCFLPLAIYLLEWNDGDYLLKLKSRFLTDRYDPLIRIELLL